MKLPRLIKLREIVEEILRKDTLARVNDSYLILKVIEKLYPDEIGKSFAQVMFSAGIRGVSFESITRVRRKIQQKHPELRDEETATYRNEEQEEYIQFSRGY